MTTLLPHARLSGIHLTSRDMRIKLYAQVVSYPSHAAVMPSAPTRTMSAE